MGVDWQGTEGRGRSEACKKGGWIDFSSSNQWYIVYGRSSVSNDPSISSPPHMANFLLPPPDPERYCRCLYFLKRLRMSHKSPSSTFVHPSGVEHYLSDSINALRNCYGDKQLFTPF
ncbi:sucrose-phosphatase 2-like [Pyrus ussuriensis x Pyrus communis]|uniref:Sucrose-phosphatase 2-like n=1 Tax=Pyrus ussuriensis x Pyrus communis TaxID=2448454 RepID=A0A5N5I6Q4_9ROSA|nr:sucrose-phosphatase 2-like [Pyrus ussuriensis x Pyrus communis]